MDKTHIEQQLTDFYVKSYELTQNGATEELRVLYLEMCEKLEELIPVNYFGLHNLELTSNKFEKVLVVANHITTPSMFAIQDEEFIKSLGLQKELLAWEQIQPLVIRHYPLINALSKFKYNATVVSGEDETVLSRFATGWGITLLPNKPGNRLDFLRDVIINFPYKRAGFIIFPEGKDSPDYPLENYYQLEEFKSGFAVLAHDFAFPVVPISLTFDVEELAYTLRVNEPILPTKSSDIESVRVEAQERVMDGIEQNLEEL